MIDALIFDFDGVVVDSEPIHLAAYQRVLGAIGVALTDDDYYRLYLGYDDHDCLQAVAAAAGRTLSEREIADLTAAKTRQVQRVMAEGVRALPGAVELIRDSFGRGILLAICSGALREEIELACRAIGVLDCFHAVVAARDVRRGKPDSEGYLTALDRLRASPAAAGRDLRADRCIAVEDSPAGIQAAKAAGMRVLAVTNSYPAERLAAADRIVASLDEVTPASLAEMTK